MKTFWQRYDEKWAHAKRREFEAKTGVPWDFYGARGGMQFTPIVTRETPTDEALALRLLLHLRPGIGGGEWFVSLAERSGMTLCEVMIAAKTLVYSGRAVADVNRTGNFAAIHRRLR